MIETISHAGKTFALILRRDFRKDGLEFFTSNEYSQQLAYMKHPAGHRIKPHLHHDLPREVRTTQEVLIVKSGRVRVDFYDEEKAFLQSETLGPLDIILLASGGHGFTMLEETEMIEVKTGPFLGTDADKEKFADPDHDER